MKSLWILPLTAALLLTTSACNTGASDKAAQELRNAADEVRETKDSLIAKGEEVIEDLQAWKEKFAFQHFAPDSADAMVNRIHFELLTGLPCTPHIYEVYAWGDQMPPDQKFQLSFKCGPEVIVSLLDSLDLRPVANDPHFPKAKGLMQEFDWWSLEELDALQPFGNNSTDRVQVLWYNDKEGRAFLHDYDL